MSTDWHTLTELAWRKINKHERGAHRNRHNTRHWVTYWIRFGDSRPSRKILNHFVNTEYRELSEVTYFYDRIYQPTTHSVKTHRLR